MLTYSTEAAFFLTLFELVVSGLPLGALLWVQFRERRRFPAHGGFLAGFALLSAGFVMQATYLRISVPPVPPEVASYSWLPVAADGARAAAAVALGAAFLLMRGRVAARPRFLFFGIAIVLIGAFRAFSESWMGPSTIDSPTALRLAEVAVLGLAIAWLGWPPGLPGLALGLLGLGRLSGLAGTIRPQEVEAWWSLGTGLVLIGLILLALNLERISRGRMLQYVLRFNLTFLMLAISLTIALAEIGRRQFIEFSALQIHDLAEFARGHLVHEIRTGAAPEEILARPTISAGLIREFGRYPDLRRILLELDDHGMAIEIQPTGEIGQDFWTGRRSEPAPQTPEDFTHALLLRLPVLVEGRRVGQVSLYHDVLSINSRIGQQMRIAFAVFTLFVVVGSIVTGILVLVADRTILRQERELAEAQRRLLASERLASVGAVADGVAHEINNPVGVLVARSDYLLSVIRGKSYAPEIQDDLDTIRRQAQRVAKTIQDLLNSTRSARRMNDEVSIEGVVSSAIKLVEPVVRDRGVTFQFLPGPGKLCVRGNHDRLEQVFINLLSNAIQAIPGEGSVQVAAAVRPRGDWVDITVTDSGAGIEPAIIGRIFDRFFTTKEPGSGTGLGLSIVSGIVRDHGGYIEVESKVGRGSQFRVALRACDSLSPPPEPPLQERMPDAAGSATGGSDG